MASRWKTSNRTLYMNRNFVIPTIILLFITDNIISQSLEGLFTYQQFIEQVENHHPVFYQARLLGERAKANQMMANGNLDPKLEAGYDHKTFDGKNYYSILSTGIKIPTWFGPELKAGYDRTSGQYLNPSENLPERGIWNAGISFPLGKGLLIDNRRAEIKKARIYTSATFEERKLMMNDILYDASMAYFTWQEKYFALNIALEGIQLAEQRLEGTTESFINGDKPAIDTLESLLSLQSRNQERLEALQNLENAMINLQNFLWLDGYIPLEISDDIFPESINIQAFQNATDSIMILNNQIVDNHPRLRLYNYKLDELQIDSRLQRENLKPDLSITYNPLAAVADDALFESWQLDNYKWGATFSIPLLLRKERGKQALTKIKIRETSYDRDLKKMEIRNKLNTYQNNILVTSDQLALQNNMVENYQRMLSAENQKFTLGESSVFLVNSRESKYLEGRKKLLDIQAKLIKHRLSLLHAGASLDSR